MLLIYINKIFVINLNFNNKNYYINIYLINLKIKKSHLHNIREPSLNNNK
jgi:hypothetical protein